MKWLILPLLAAAVFCTSCSGKDAHAQSPDAQPSTQLLIDSRGVAMSLASAVKTVNFVPFIPSAQIIRVAVIPPLSDAQDHRAVPGIAIEYESGGDALLLSQWLRGGLAIAVGADDLTTRPCAPAAYKADGLLWTTRNGRVMTLQPDGPVVESRIANEANRLLRAGACGRPVKTLSRPLRTRLPAVSLPRRSAF
ncbi:MAG TPA: hypothetical protein VKT72_01370 [Candidatus Baltobacteraceae bacterium]|nr:hypothetical protein [Candidatus Baltobacteraceae bacterium]